MQSKIFTVYDSKLEVHIPPFVAGTRGEAIRSFSDTLNDASHPMAKHPEDVTLFVIGEYDNATAKITPYPTPISLGLGLDFVKSENKK